MKRLWIVAPVTFICWQLILRWSLDLSDIPGAAGTETLVKAAKGQVRGDSAGWLIHWLQRSMDMEIVRTSSLTSFIAGSCALAGAILGGKALAGNKGAFGAGLLTAAWTMTHYFSLLNGADPLAFGTVWLGIGLCWAGVSGGISGLIMLLIGVTLIPAAVSFKQLAIPAAAFVFMTPIFLRKWRKKHLFVIPVILYSAYWAYAWMWPDGGTDLSPEAKISFNGLFNGWERLTEFYERGIPEGKFDQLMIIGLLLAFLPGEGRIKRISVAAGGCIVLCVTADLLDQRSRPRYLAAAAYGSIVATGAGLAVLGEKFRHGILVTVGLAATLFITDGWAFFDTWSEKREEITGSQKTRLPRAPSIWRAQYRDMPDLTHRDLTLYGGAALSALVMEGSGVATPRLRDERHRSLAAYATIRGVPYVVLDPGKCCGGQPVDSRCASETVEKLRLAGIRLAIPVEIKGVERIYKHEKNWVLALEAAASEELSEKRHWKTTKAVTGKGPLPCQEEIPFRSPK